MLLYEVTLQADINLAATVEAHMRREHIPRIFATGCFQRIRFDRASPARFRTSYEARTEGDLDRCLREYAPGFRAEFTAEFPTGVTVTRETWSPVERWE
jgi:hypothetical protein